MTRLFALVVLSLVGVVALMGCRVEGEVGDTTAVTVPK